MKVMFKETAAALLAAALGFCAFDARAHDLESAPAAPAADRPIKLGTPSEIPLRVKEVAADTYLVTGRGGNSVFRRTPAGLFVVDNKVMYAQVYRELIAALGNQPPVYAFVTHHHADHGGNNQRLLDDGVKLIGQRNIAAILKSYKSSIAPVNPATPDILFDRQYDVDLGGVKAIAYYWGPAHTDADIAILFPDRRLVVAGDILNLAGEIAIDALDGKGSLLGLRDRIDDLLKLDFDIAIPGHGDNVMTRAEVEIYRKRVDALIERGIAAIRNGVQATGLRDAMRSDELGFRLVGHFWTDPNYLAPIYAELERAAAAK